MIISHNFDAGNIEVVSCDDPQDIRLNIRPDHNSEFYQWFYFRLSGAKQTDCKLHLLNANGSAYPPGFSNYRVLYSYDRKEWRRHPTQLKDGVLSFDFTPIYESVYFAYFIPYSMERHLDLVATAQLSAMCTTQVLGKTLDGQDIDLLKFSLPNSTATKKNCWVIARQHPGESMAEWWIEGCIESLLGGGLGGKTEALLKQCNIFLVPNMNPDGSRRGHLRTNAAGRNLNREWENPSLETSPEVFWVKQAMSNTGVDFFLDVHGDESLPYCFIAGTEGLATWDSQNQRQLDFYKETLAQINPDFQTAKGYPPKPRGQANLTMSTVQTAHLHGCLAMTLEMPFKDAAGTPDERYGWSTDRSKKLARSCLEVLRRYLESDLID